MKDTDFDAHRLQLADTTPSWEKPSRCKRPPFVMVGGQRRQVDPFEDGWRDAEFEPDDSRPFRPVPLPAHRMSPWPIIIATTVCTTACALMIGWFLEAALRSTTPDFWRRLAILVAGH